MELGLQRGVGERNYAERRPASPRVCGADGTEVGAHSEASAGADCGLAYRRGPDWLAALGEE